MVSTNQDQRLQTLARMAVKNGVSLGGLPADERLLALGSVWACLPAHVLREAEVNDVLRQVLAGPACWLDTDHVELRRWLVDTGWVVRDGFGHAYQCVQTNDLPDPLQALGRGLTGLNLSAWLLQVRQQHQERRQARRQAWERQA